MKHWPVITNAQLRYVSEEKLTPDERRQTAQIVLAHIQDQINELLQMLEPDSEK